MTPEPLVRPDPASGGHLPALDGVRGMAIVLVLVFHLVLYGAARPAGHASKLLYEVAMAGWVGVDLFFVLSGFLITGILYDAKGGARYFEHFYARRAIRIFPLYFVFLAATLALLPWVFPRHAGLQALTEQSAWYWTYTTNVLIARDGWPGFGALGHLWSLAVEEQFYLLWPLAVLWLGRRELLVLCAAGAILSLGVRAGLHASGHVEAAFVLMPARMDALAAGAAVALLARGPDGLAPARRGALVVTAVCGGSLAAIALVRRGLGAEDGVVQTVGYTLLALLFASLLVVVLTAPRTSVVRTSCESGALTFFGRYSYALYVVHHPLLFFVPPTVLLGVLPGFRHAEAVARLLFMAGVAALSVVLAVLSWHLLEKHFLRLKYLFPYGRPAPASGRSGIGRSGIGRSAQGMTHPDLAPSQVATVDRSHVDG